jgi:phosphoglycerate kinase
MPYKKLSVDFANDDLTGKKVILRVDLNLPIQSGFISDKTRLVNIIPTINFLKEKGAAIILISHFGRPDGEVNQKYSLKQILQCVKDELKCDVAFANDVLKADKECSELKPRDVLLLENLRFYKEEEQNDSYFASKIAQYGDIYVNDAFGCSHRKHASIHSITKFIPSYAGLLLEKEIDNVEKILLSKDSITCLVGGSKISTKIDLLKNLVKKTSNLVIGGGMANTFYYAMGHSIGKSLYEPDYKDIANAILSDAKKYNCNVVLAKDVFVTKDVSNPSDCRIIDIKDIKADEMIVDIGFTALGEIETAILASKIVVWNGPFGVFEKRPFNIGTESIARIIAYNTSIGSIYSIIGGGDVVSAVAASCLSANFSYISTGGGSFLEYLEKNSLPGIDVLC